jgi:RNA polymerase sigma-70 factor (ECF subfamily)
MDATARETLEREVRTLCESGDTARATHAVILGLGPEIHTFLHGLLRAEHDADEVFSLWSERVLLGIGAFAWGCSLRTWSYAIARNLASNYRRGQQRRRVLPGADTEQIERLEQHVRSQTRPHLRTESKDKLARIRETLPPDDRTLLVLRVDRELDWNAIAQVMSDNADALAPADLAREAQRLRKRFQLVKEKLVTLARQQGFVED